ncbi:MAG: hypothetical protein KDB84_05740, partial [Flavobacteriales bacterium]|nr:hypothetical protein [Flavobacteriales bacterium]
GVTLMNFFAHAYSENFDITIDNPANYDWHGKHPLVIGNSCYIGNIHLNNSTSTGEQWVLMPNKGPIGFMSTVSTGLAPTLAQYTQEFYRSFSQVNYGGSIGQHMAHAVRQQLGNSSDLRAVSNAHQFTLEGDPSLILNSWPEPDYAITDEDILFEPVPVTADVDSFRVKAVVRNIGRAVNTTFNVALDRTNTGLGPTQTYLTTMSDLHYQDTAYFHIPTLAGDGGEGVNAIQVRVDLDPDEVDELQETLNNVAGTTLFITSGDVIPAYPYDFAILPDPAPPLKASTGDPLAPVRTYVFQIDTTDLFNSPVMESGSITAPGGVITWQPGAIYALNNAQDSTVFFWRCSIDSTGNGGYNWYERSFQFLEGREGWGQAHYFQFKNDTYNGVIYDRPEREFDFFSGQRNLRAFVRDSVPDNNTGWNLDLQPQEYNNGCGGVAAWMIAVVDPYTFEPWGTYWQDGAGQTFNADHQFGNLNNGSSCRDRVEQVFSFRTNDAAQLAGMADMLDNQIPVGHHILGYTWRYLDQDGTTTNGPSAVAALQNLGVPDFSTMRDSAAYIFYVRKGYPATFQDTIAPAVFPPTNDPNEDGIIDLSVYVSGLWNQGTITTMQAGPASAWHGLYWNEWPSDAQDSTRIKLIGVTPAGVEVELLDNPASLDEVTDLGSIVSAEQYPTLRIKGNFFDLGSQQPKPSQMERWQLLSSPAPECAIDPPLGYFNALNDLFQGQEASVAVAVHNIGVVPMDSLLMTAWVVDRNNVRHRIHYNVNGPLPVDGVVIDTVRFSTLGFGGPNTLIIEANPIDTLTGAYHQLEQYHFNNLVQWRFNVEVDNENPLLDVTFDGVHILDGDIVSARPEIVMTLDDENPVLLLDSPADTANFKVYLTRPGAGLERLYFRTGDGVEQLRFEPATGPENECRIIYAARFPADGTYTLTVQATDLSNNTSGDHDYKVSFEVLNRPTITEVLNYPNPFTTSTRFVFTVTGVEPPTYMKIQIMTVTGRVVREVKMHELGPIRVGRNLTEFAWDGTDEFGDRLARGVYLYRVIAQLNGQDIEYRQTGAADYFTKGFGKMYLLR